MKRTVEVDAQCWEEPAKREKFLARVERDGYTVLAFRCISDCKYEVTLLPAV